MITLLLEKENFRYSKLLSLCFSFVVVRLSIDRHERLLPNQILALYSLGQIQGQCMDKNTELPVLSLPTISLV